MDKLEGESEQSHFSDTDAGRSSQNQDHLPVARVVPVVIIAPLAAAIPSTTMYMALQETICRDWYQANDPTSIPANGTITPELCSVSAVQERVTLFPKAAQVIASLGGLLTIHALIASSRKYGSRTVFLTVLTLFSLIAAFYSAIPLRYEHPWLQIVVFVLWSVWQQMSLGYISLLADLTIIDTVNFSQRTAAFGQLSGWYQLGTIGGMASTVIGGIIFTIFSSFKGMFMATALLLAACVGCAWALLFEQNPRNKLAVTSKETRVIEPIASSWKLAVTSISGIMDILRPRRSPETGKHNWRILLCCIYEVMFSIGGACMAPSESIVKRLSEHNQLIVKAFVNGASIFLVSLLTLLVFIPLVIKYRTRAIYARTPRRIAPALPGSKRTTTGTVIDAVDGLNVNIAITSMIAQVISLVILGLSSSWTAQMIGIILYGMSVGHSPAMKNVLLTSLGPTQLGDTLVSFHIVKLLVRMVFSAVIGNQATSLTDTNPHIRF